MATFNWPGFGIKAVTWTLDQPSQVNTSPYSGTRSVVSTPWHGKWSAHVELATQQGDSAFRVARAFFTSLKGQISTFHLPAVEALQNTNTGVTVGTAAAQGATSLSITGVATALVAGNMVTIAGQLLSLTSVGSLSGSTQAINFMPALRAAASVGASVETAKPYALVALNGGSFSWDIATWRLYGLSFDCQEAVGESDGADPANDVWTGSVSGTSSSSASYTFPELPSFTTRALLAGVSAPTDKQIAYLTEPGLEGDFEFHTGNYSSYVSSNGRDYVAPSSDTSGASGAWVRNGRTKLFANLNLYVGTGGNDANDGTSSGAAFLTIQRAVACAYSSLDLNGFQIIINVANGTYTAGAQVYGPLIGANDPNLQPLQIIGNEASPGSVIVSPTGNTAFSVQNWAYVFLAGLTIQTTSGGYGLNVKHHSTVEHRNLVFGNVNVDMIIAQMHAQVIQVANADGSASTTNVTGNANAFVHCTKRSLVAFTDQKIAFNGNTFSTYLWGLNDASVELDGVTITGARPTTTSGTSAGCTVHDGSLLNAYSVTNAGGWGFLPISTIGPLIQDGSTITADAYEARTFYVRSDATGNSNDGCENTVGRAFKSIQSCIDFIASLPFNPANFNDTGPVVIHVADGTYAETIHLREIKAYVGGQITGNTTTPGNVIINGVDDGISAIGLATTWIVEGMKPSAASGSCLRVENGSRVTFDNITFGTATANHIQVKSGGRVLTSGNYTIAGNASRHLLIQGASFVDLSSRTITFSGTITFSQFVELDQNSALVLKSVTWSGSFTGTRYSINTCSSLDTSGQATTWIPGSSAGSTASGGQYA